MVHGFLPTTFRMRDIKFLKNEISKEEFLLLTYNSIEKEISAKRESVYLLRDFEEALKLLEDMSRDLPDL